MATQQITTRQIRDGAINNAKVAAGAAIAYSKLNLAASIVNADVDPTAAIAYSKLSLSNSLTVADVSSAAKDSAATANTLALRDASGRLQVASPSVTADAANKGYVDSAVATSAAGLVGKGTVRALASTNQTLSGTPTIDGVSLVGGELVLLTGQTAPAENGPWTVAAGAWARPSNFDTSAEATPNAYWFVEEGTVYGDTGWWLITNDPITLGTTALTIAQFVGPGTFTAGTGLQLSNGQFSLTNTGVTAGTYEFARVVVDAQGRLSSVTARAFSKGGGSATGGETTINTVASPIASSSQLTINGTVKSETAGHYTINATSGVITLQDALDAGDVYEWQVMA